MKTTITIEIDTDGLQSVEDSYLAQLWHITQANPAPYDSKVAIEASMATLNARSIRLARAEIAAVIGGANHAA